MTDNTREVQLKATMDATGVRAGVDQAKTALGDLGNAAEREGAKAGAGLGKTGEGAEKAGQKVERETRSMISSIERATAAFKAGEKGGAAYFEELAKQRGISGDTLKPYIEQLRQAEAAQKSATTGLGNMGVSAKQTAAALRQVPAQFSDIIISLQAGQNPISVFLQQGSQLKDTFGGAGAAAKALGGYVLGLVNPMTLAAAAVAILTVGYFKGAAEAEGYNRAIVLTGNAAGVTAGQLQTLAQAQAKVVGTQSAAAEALTALTATGKVAAVVLPFAAEASTRLDRVGVALDDTVKKFASLGKEPLKALIDLNEAENFLTVSVYRQVKSLVDQGKTVEAVTVAQREYARVGIERAKALETGLGTLEKSWKAVGDTAKGAWDRMLNVGRASTVEVEIQKAEAFSARLNAALKGDGLAGPRPTFEAFFGGRSIEQQLRDNDALIARLRESVKLGQDVAAATGKQTDAVKDLRKADEAAADAAKKVAQAREQEAVAFERILGLTGSYQKDLEQLVRWREKGKLSEEQYLDAVRKLIAEQPVARAQIEAQAAAQKEAAKALDDLLKAEQRRIDGLYKNADQVAANVLKLQEEEKAIALAAAGNISLAEAIERVTIARLEEAHAKATAQNDYGAAAAIREEISQREKLAGLIGKREAREAAKRGANEAAKEWKRATDDIERSLTDALMRGFESGKGFGEALRDTLISMFKTLVLRPLIQPVVQGASGQVQSWFGGSGSGGGNMLGSLGNGLSAFGDWMGADSTVGGWASTAGSWLKGGAASGSGLGSSVLGLMGNFGGGLSAGYGAMMGGNLAGGWSAGTTALGAGNISGGLGTMGGMAAGAIGGFMAGRGVGQAISNGYSAIGGQSGNSAVNTGAAIGAAIGSIIPGLGTLIGGLIGGALGGLTNRAFGHKAKEYGETGITGMASMSGFAGQTYGQWTQKGGWFRSDKSGTDFGALAAEQETPFDDGIKALYASTLEYVKVLGLPEEALKGYSASFKVAWGETEEENQKAIQDAFASLGDQLVAQYATQLAPLQKAGETLSATLARLSSLQVFSNSLNTLGGVFSRLAGSSVDAREQMIGLAGGMDALAAQALSFAQNYYNRDEIAGMKAADVKAALTAAGITTEVNSREEFRALVESLDPASATGRQQLAALLGLQGSFATVADYLAETGQTLGQVASQAPATDALSPLLSQSSQQVQLTQQSVDIQYETRDATLQIVKAVDRLTNLVASSGGSSSGSGWMPGYRQPEVTLAT